MKVIILSEDTIINEKFYRKGEVVQVDDDFDLNIKEVIIDDGKDNLDKSKKIKKDGTTK